MDIMPGKELNAAPRLRDLDADLNDKLRVIPVRHVTTSSSEVTKEEVVKGLTGEASHEFFARLFRTQRNYDTFKRSFTDPDVMRAVDRLSEEPFKLKDALLEVMGGGVGVLPRHPYAARRFADFIAYSERIISDANEYDRGQGVTLEPQPTPYARFVSSPGGNEAAAELFSDPVGPFIIAQIQKSGGDAVVGIMLEAKIRGQKLREKQSIRELWPLAKASGTGHISAQSSDSQIRDILGGQDLGRRYGTIAEFFSTDEKYERFLRFTEDGGSSRLVADTLKVSPARTVLAFFDVLHTEGGGRRLARAIIERNDIIFALGSDIKAQEAIFTLFNAPPLHEGEEGEGKRVMKAVLGMDGGLPASVKVMASIYAARIRNLKGGRGDIPLDGLEEIKAERGA
jgi:hypothetical protein